MEKSQKISVAIFVLVVLAIMVLANQNPSFHTDSLATFTEGLKKTSSEIEKVSYRMQDTTFFIALEIKDSLGRNSQTRLVNEVGEKLLQNKAFDDLMLYDVEVLKRPGINSINVELKMPDSGAKFEIVLEKYLGVGDAKAKFRMKSIEKLTP